jgi:hypothetical protein
MILYAVIENNSPENAPTFKTIREALDFIKSQKDGKERWVHSVEIDIQKEIEDAWMDGNQKGWEMSTDWPESATEYYKKRFGID